MVDVKHSKSATRKRRLFSRQTSYGVRFPKAHGLMFHFPAILTILGYAHVTHRYVTRHILISKKNLANYKILSSHTFFFFFTRQIFFFYNTNEPNHVQLILNSVGSAQLKLGTDNTYPGYIYIYKTLHVLG